ncbi:MAG: hypothetical protein V4690_04010 [Patescibacteria group bacterium]
MSEPLIFPSDKKLAMDLLWEKKLVLMSMLDLDAHFVKLPPPVCNLADVDKLTRVFMNFDGDIEDLQDEVVILEMLCDWEMN